MKAKKRKNEFSKKDFVKTIIAVINRSLSDFDYTRKPYLKETKLEGDALMAFYGRGKFTVVAYDYDKFRKRVRNDDSHLQYVFAVQCMAHEMRHYYQHRQITALNPVENKKTIDEWRENKIVKSRSKNKVDDYEYWFSSRELDANLYGHVFALYHLKRVVLDSIRSEDHFNALKKYYKRLGGKHVKKYFPNKIKKIVKK